MEQCIYCESVYNLEESDSSVPSSLCSEKCEKGFKEHQRQIRDFFINETISDNMEALDKLSKN
jgi:hypothetical protein